MQAILVPSRYRSIKEAPQMLSRRLFLTIAAAVAGFFTFRRQISAELLFVCPLRKEKARLRPDAFTAKGKALVAELR